MSTIDRVGTEGVVPNAQRVQELAEAARQFEAIFTKQLLGSMRKTLPQSSLFPKGPGHTLYDHMMDSEMAQHMSKGGGMGIAKFLFQQWTGQSMPTPAALSAVAGAVTRDITAAPTTHLEHRSVDVLGEVPEDTIHHNEHNDGRPSGRIDNGRELLRNLLPPTGLEKKEVNLLNQNTGCNDHPYGGASSVDGAEGPLRGSTDGHKETDNSAYGRKQPNQTRVRSAESPTGKRQHATQQYRSLVGNERFGSEHRGHNEPGRIGEA